MIFAERIPEKSYFLRNVFPKYHDFLDLMDF